MNTIRNSPASGPSAQFGLPSLLEYMTVCAALSALSAATGVAAAGLLMLMALALWARQGALALLTLMGASLAADWPLDPLRDGASLGRQVVVMLAAAALSAWYALRRGLALKKRQPIS